MVFKRQKKTPGGTVHTESEIAHRGATPDNEGSVAYRKRVHNDTSRINRHLSRGVRSSKRRQAYADRSSPEKTSDTKKLKLRRTVHNSAKEVEKKSLTRVWNARLGSLEKLKAAERNESFLKQHGSRYAKNTVDRQADAAKRTAAVSDDARPAAARWPPPAPPSSPDISNLDRVSAFFGHLNSLASNLHTCLNCRQSGHDHGTALRPTDAGSVLTNHTCCIGKMGSISISRQTTAPTPHQVFPTPPARSCRS